MFILAGFLGLGVLWVASGERSFPPADVGTRAPDFVLEDLEGNEVALSDYRGRVVLLNFWATWCKPCEEEMPAMQRLYEALSPAGFVLLAVSIDDGIEEVREFRDEKDLRFTILHDPAKQAAERYQSFRYPETFLIDTEGILAARYIGPREWDAPAYRSRIERLLQPPAQE